MPARGAKGAATRERLHVPPRERLEFKKLLATNPNYFGNLEKSQFEPVKKILGNTTYEEVSCVGFNPALNLLEATIQIKRPGGYNGTLCMPGSTEYVRFFVDYGAGWVDAGLAAFNAHDIANTLDCARHQDKPLTYVVTLALDPERQNCRHPVLPNVRAILSWQLIPQAGNANWPPIWGNVLDEHIQITPRPLWFGDVVEMVPSDLLKTLPQLAAEVKPLPIPLPDPPPMSLSSLAELYQTKGKSKAIAVEPHRFGFAHLQPLMESGDQFALAVAAEQWKAVGLDLSVVVAALDKTKADVSYEELECLGLEYNLERLIATFRIKRPLGYSGDLCTRGSLEYVAFWVDWDNSCEWTYLNTVSVNVHDIATLPPGGLAYSAILPVDLSAIRRPCGGRGGGPKIARIRAVLSWSTPPSTTNPDALTHWGNRLDAHVQIRPGAWAPGDQPVISIIGGIGVADINVFGDGMTKPLATFAFGGDPADPWLLNRECPFGGRIIVQGPPVPGFKYRLWARRFGDPLTEEVVKSTFHVVNWLGVGSNVTPDPLTGYAAYMSTLANMDQVLAHWTPSGDDLHEIRLEMATLGGVVVGTTPWHSIQLDNTAPRRRPAVLPYEPPPVTCEIHIDSGGDCKDFTKGTTIQGHFVARDAHFGGFTLSTLPSSMLPNAPTTATPATTETATFLAGGDEWELDTTGMQPCGYVVLLRVWDRSIVGSQSGSHNHNTFDVGFCLRK
jgi:hypothetical protein